MDAHLEPFHNHPIPPKKKKKKKNLKQKKFESFTVKEKKWQLLNLNLSSFLLFGMDVQYMAKF